MPTDAPAWLREAFADGVDEYERQRRGVATSAKHSPYCVLAAHDERQRPCEGRFERFHYIGRQRVEAVVWEHLRHARIREPLGPDDTILCPEWRPLIEVDFGRLLQELVMLAEWDARNGGWGCEIHHRRFDRHLTPALTIPRVELPLRTLAFVADFGLEGELESSKFR